MRRGMEGQAVTKNRPIVRLPEPGAAAIVGACLVCGERHRNPVRGGKVAYLRHCFKRGRLPSKFTSWRVKRLQRERESVLNELREALDSWGASGGNGYGQLEVVE